jgi:hypothetical protein
MPEKKYYIEFVGVNGSGKTTLGDKLAGHLTKRGWSVIDLPRTPRGVTRKSRPFARFRKMLKYYFFHPFCFAECVYVRWHPAFRYRGSLHTLIKRKYKAEKHFRKNLDAILNHEGTFQFYRTAGHHIGRVTRLPQYHAIFRARECGYQPIVINLRVDGDSALARCGQVRPSVKDPANWSLANEPADRQRKLMEKWVTKKDRIMDLIRDHGIRVIDVSTSVSADESFARLLDELHEVIVDKQNTVADKQESVENNKNLVVNKQDAPGAGVA